MEERLTDNQLEKVVAEVQRLSQQREAELDRDEVRKILQDLDLPPELLEEAMIQVQRREVLSIEQKRDRWIMVGGIIFTVLAIIGVIVFTQHQQQIINRVTAQRDRVTLSQDNGGNLNSISRQTAGQVVYRVTLSDAPVGQKLTLSCNWIDPSGQIVHQNRYETKEITTPVWNTFCRYQLGMDSPVGNWKVEAFLGDRRLSDATFTVK